MRGRIGTHLRGNVIGYVALFVALSGTAWAVQNDSVRSRHIVDGQVKTPDLADNAVTNAKVADDAIGSAEVAPNSLAGGDLDESSLNLAAEPWHEITPAEFSSGCWANRNAAGRNTAAYYRDPFGVVHLKGNVRRFATDGPTETGIPCYDKPVIFTLPPGYRPLGDEKQITSNDNSDYPNGVATITIVRSNADPFSGRVTLDRGDPNFEGLFLDGISFRCGPSGQNGCP
ncbi:MAG: hypothetical protein ACR2G3_04845 [Solirubrobacterales bacterium]